MRHSLSQKELNSFMHSHWLGHTCHYYSSIDSTNSEAKRQLQKNASNGDVFIASHQSAGKGRAGKTWISAEGSSIACSILLRPDHLSFTPTLLTHLTAAALHQTLAVYAPIKIKWPNDIVIHGKKISGILIETTYTGTSLQGIIVGVGINIFQQNFEENNLNRTAASLEEFSPVALNPNIILADFLSCFETMYESLLSSNDRSFLSVCRHSSSVIGKKVLVIRQDCTEIALAEDLTDSGELKVTLETTGEHAFLRTGEVSVRGEGVYE